MASEIIVAASVILLLWWFRYACRLILTAQPARDYTAEVARANGLRLPGVQQALSRACGSQEFDQLLAKLQADYRLLTYLLCHGPAFQPGDNWIELRLQMLNFAFLRGYYSIIRPLSNSQARWSVQEMAQVIVYFANRMGERVAFATAAF